MIKKPVTVQKNTGLEERPIAVLVQIANKYASEVYIEDGNKQVNAKSIMGMMTLELTAGRQVTVVADGEDEEEAAEGMIEFLQAE
ncbi:MAG: HPr family phosphocarrier protein [Lachnospiraceae bacterium]